MLDFWWYFVAIDFHILKVEQRIVQIKVFNVSYSELGSCILVIQDNTVE